MDTMIDQERPVMFVKIRPFFGAQMGDYCNIKILKSHGFIGFEVYSMAAIIAATLSKKQTDSVSSYHHHFFSFLAGAFFVSGFAFSDG